MCGPVNSFLSSIDSFDVVQLMTAFQTIYTIPKIRNIPLYRLAYSIACTVSWCVSNRQILGNAQPYYLWCPARLYPCSGFIFTVYASSKALMSIHFFISRKTKLRIIIFEYSEACSSSCLDFGPMSEFVKLLVKNMGVFIKKKRKIIIISQIWQTG